MSTPITPTPVIPPASYPIPAPGESVNSAGVAAYVQPLANSIDYLRIRVPGAVANMVRSVPMCAGVGSLWTRVMLGTMQQTWLQTATTGVVSFMITNLLPPSGTIVGASCLLDGGTGHSGLPGTMPIISLVKWPTNFGNASFQTSGKVTVQSDSDPTGSLAAYEKVHAVNLSPVAETISINNFDYGIEISGEDGAGAIYNQLMLGRLTFMVSP